MKKLMIFYQERCPFCKRAFNYIEELKNENPLYNKIAMELIEETLQPDFADTFDYYYVPTFYVDGEKVHEGGIKKDEVKAILDRVIR